MAGTARERRNLWEAGDVVFDDLASRGLVLNLSAEGTGLAEWLAGAARHGVPFYVTLHQLMTLPLTIRDAVVYVCENPAVLRHAAAELGSGSAPLLCTEGRPSTAFHQLADVVVSGGGELRYHGDFDWPGLAIASAVMRRHGARPWRMSADDYMAGVRVHAEHVLLSGRPQRRRGSGAQQGHGRDRTRPVRGKCCGRPDRGFVGTGPVRSAGLPTPWW
jgi:uncharacterized protein (TIGR02679 family)